MKAAEGINRLVQQYEGEGRRLLRVETWANCLYLRFETGRNTMITRKGRRNWGGIGKTWEIHWMNPKHTKSARRYRVVTKSPAETLFWFNPKKWREEEEQRERDRIFIAERHRRLAMEEMAEFKKMIDDFADRVRKQVRERQKERNLKTAIRELFIDCATEADIKTRYRKLAMQFHPDAGGTAEEFRALKDEYDSLMYRLERFAS